MVISYPFFYLQAREGLVEDISRQRDVWGEGGDNEDDNYCGDVAGSYFEEEEEGEMEEIRRRMRGREEIMGAWNSADDQLYHQNHHYREKVP